jgi:hypothetical protein
MTSTPESKTKTVLTKAEQGPTLLADATDIIWHKTMIRMYGVSDAQLEELTAGYNSLHLICFGICLGAAVTLLIAFEQTAEKSPDKPYYLAVFVAAAGLSAFFGINGIANYWKASRRKKQLYRESVPIEK